MLADALPSFVLSLNPAHATLGSTLIALIPIVLLLILLPVLRMSAWQAVIIGSAVTIILAITVWGAPVSGTFGAWGVGAGTGFWSIDWIVFWGVIIYQTLVTTGAFGDFRRWLIAQATADIRVQAILLAWALGALLEGLVGFGYPWAVIAPILAGLGVMELDAIRVAAIANNAPVSFGALGAPIIALATGRPSAARGQAAQDRLEEGAVGAFRVGGEDEALELEGDRAVHRRPDLLRHLDGVGSGDDTGRRGQLHDADQHPEGRVGVLADLLVVLHVRDRVLEHDRVEVRVGQREPAVGHAAGEEAAADIRLGGV
jgi:L-lactate permease